MDTLTLRPELDRFAGEAVAARRLRDLSELAAAGVNLRQRQEQARAALNASLEAAAEGELDGCFRSSVRQVLEETAFMIHPTFML